MSSEAQRTTGHGVRQVHDQRLSAATPERRGIGSVGFDRDTALRAAERLAVVTSLLGAVAGAWTFFGHGLLHGPAAMQGSARGTALVLGSVAVPLLAVSVWRARQGSGAATLTWAGALLYVVYNAILLLFLTPFNAAFLVYVALLGTALWSLGFLLLADQTRHAGEAVAARAPVRGVATYVWVVAGLNLLAWLAKVIPALGDAYPSRLVRGTGVETNAIYVQDLAIWLPLALVGAWWLARRQPRGAVVVGAVLVMWVVEGVSVAVDQWLGVRADATSTVVSSSVVLPFLVIAMVGLVPVWALLRSGSSTGDLRPWPASRAAAETASTDAGWGSVNKLGGSHDRA